MPNRRGRTGGRARGLPTRRGGTSTASMCCSPPCSRSKCMRRGRAGSGRRSIRSIAPNTPQFLNTNRCFWSQADIGTASVTLQNRLEPSDLQRFQGINSRAKDSASPNAHNGYYGLSSLCCTQGEHNEQGIQHGCSSGSISVRGRCVSHSHR